MNKYFIIAGIGILVLALGAFALMGGEEEVFTEPEETEVQDETIDDDEEENVMEFHVLGGNYYYSMEEIRVQQGDLVRITFESEEGFHDLVVDEFDVATDRLRPEDDSVTVEFVAEETGEFEYYCSVGQHRELGQVGTLIVE